MAYYEKCVEFVGGLRASLALFLYTEKKNTFENSSFKFLTQRR